MRSAWWRFVAAGCLVAACLFLLDGLTRIWTRQVAILAAMTAMTSAAAVALVLRRMARLVAEREEARRELQRRVLHDPLTGLPNRDLLADRLEQGLARAERGLGIVAVMLFDLDGFKEINDRLGHRAGDQLLIHVARRARGLLRDQDTLVRFAGDEFVIVCEGADESVAWGIAERVRRHVQQPVDLDGGGVTVTASVGIAFASSGVGGADGLLRDADTAMRRAKEAGGDRVQLFDEVLQRRRDEQRHLRAALAEAPARQELQLVYQPLVALGKDEQVPAYGDVVVGVEALVRWRHPRDGWLSPAEFLPEDSSDLVVPVNHWVLHEACRQLARWQAMLPADIVFTLFVNLSPRQLSDPLLVDGLVRSFEETGANPRGLGLEVTERAFVSPGRELLPAVHQLMAMGVRLAVDDFGTGTSSIDQVRRLPVDLIKVDASLVTAIERRTPDRAVVSAVVGMARELGITVLAEGVETGAQLQAVRELGCHMAQGFYLGVPVPPARIDPLLGWTRDDTPLHGA